jgi:hypothetical protein
MFFMKPGYPSLCIKEMHTVLHLFQLFNKEWQEILKGSYKTKPPTKVSIQATSKAKAPVHIADKEDATPSASEPLPSASTPKTIPT